MHHSPCPSAAAQGFLSGDEASANAFFARASECFNKSVEQDPGSESYRRAKEMSAKVGWGWGAGGRRNICWQAGDWVAWGTGSALATTPSFWEL